jgi:hypothetical protein
MKSFKETAAQGEITIRRLGNLSHKIPKGCTAMKPEGGKFIIGHSETGHHHVMNANGASVSVLNSPPEGMRVLYAILENPISLEHLRDHDTHEPIHHEPGVYEIRIAREFDHYAELARQSAD